MEIFGLQLSALILGAIIGGFASVLIYRNNETKADPIFDKFDDKFAKFEAEMKAKIDELKRKLDEKQGY